MPRYRVRVGLHYQGKVEYRAGDRKSFESNNPMVMNDHIKYERLNDDGTPLNSPTISPFQRRSNENDDQFRTRMEELAAQARAAIASVPAQQSSPPNSSPDNGQGVKQGAKQTVKA